MGPLDLALIIVSVLALAFASIALVLVFAWRKTTPEISDLRQKFLTLSMGQTDIVDKLNHWMQRDDARHARKGKGKKHDEDEYEEVVLTPPVPQTTAERKAELRKRMIGGRLA